MALSAAFLGGAPHAAYAYTPENHELSVRQGAQQYQSDHASGIGETTLKAIIEGVLEPDGPSLSSSDLLDVSSLGSNLYTGLHMFTPSNLQMFKQRFEGNSYGNKRGVLTERIAAQSFHGSPAPTRAEYTDSEEDQRMKRQALPVPAAELLPNRFPLDVYAYDSNQDLRNRMLLNASQFLCVSLAHRDDAHSARKLGNLLHMVGDTYSASHVQRSSPEGAADSDHCGTEKIQWHFSMDLISWKQHRPADKENADWRFRCLARHTSNLMKLWVDGRAAVREASAPPDKLARANEHVATTLRTLCDRVLREDADVLRQPAGGAAAGYSITSGTDGWEYLKFWKWKRKKYFWEIKPEDTPIQPVGLTGPEEAKAFYEKVNDELKAQGGPKHFGYLPREVGDLCLAIKPHHPLPAALQCTRQEIDWAMRGAREVETLWIPARSPM